MTIVVTGTDTDIGKTVFAAGLTAALGARYWKPVQAGLADGSDAASVVTLGVPADHVLPEAYRLTTPCSPHLAAEIDGVTIDPDRLALPQISGPLIVEGAGGVMVPVTRELISQTCSHGGTSRSYSSRALGSARSTTACSRSKHCAAALSPSSASPSSATRSRIARRRSLHSARFAG